MGSRRISVNCPPKGKMFLGRKTKLVRLVLLTIIFGTMFLTLSTKGISADDLTLPARLEYINADLRDIFRNLAEIGKLKVLFANDFSGKATMIIESGSLLKQTISEIAANHGLSVKWLNTNTAVIGERNSLLNIETTDLNLHVLTLKYIPAISIAKALETVVSSYKIRYDLKANQIAVMANSLELQNIKELIGEWDHDLPLINTEIKVVEVTPAFLKAVGLSNSHSTEMKVYPLTKEQVVLIAQQSGTSLLARQEVQSFNRQGEKLFFGDQIPKITEEAKREAVNYQISYFEVGTTIDYSTRIDRQAEAELLIQLQATVETLSSGVTTKDQANPTTAKREIKTTVGLKPGETIIITGALKRDEFARMKSPLYEFSFLASLFNSPPPDGIKPSDQTATLVLMTPSFTEKVAYAPRENKNPEPVPTNDVPNTVNTTNIPYTIRRKDTLTSISRKFGVSLQAIIKENQLKNPGNIKADSILMIPVPNERIYVLKYKETIWRLAKRYGTTVAVLKNINSITDVTKLKTGQKIVLPVPVTNIVNAKY